MLKELEEIVGSESICFDEPMKKHTTFRVGGPAKALVEPSSLEVLQRVLAFCKEKSLPFYIIGRGSNLLVSDRGYDGVVICLGRNLSEKRVEGNRLILQSGVLLRQAAELALEEGLTGLEFAHGIPGTLGGAIVMNAGAYGGEMKDVVSSVKVLHFDGQIKEYDKEEMEFSYRSSLLSKKDGIVVEVVLELQKSEFPEKIAERMQELKKMRMEKQPLEYASAGSTFKRPEGFFAGKLIEDANLKGFSMGGAQVSEKHCGFVINRGNATASDVKMLIEEVQKRVYEQFSVHLETEVKFLGW